MAQFSPIQNKTILFVDDDINLCKSLSMGFKQLGAHVLLAHDGKTAIKILFDHRPDLIFLDVRMPGMSGWEVCRQIRSLSDVPIIMLTGLSAEEDVVRGLKFGADDFITKPFSRVVLFARAEAILRRVSEVDQNAQSVVADEHSKYVDSHLTVDISRREIIVQGSSVKLSATEFDLLRFLLENAGRVISYEAILNEVWGWDAKASTDYIHVYISRLRSKLEVDVRNPNYLINKRGFGYFFNRLS